ncbi:hypothetical protein RV02_GL003074 [Enterococcus gilvus]|nr:hypothetical protein RV02_GL003074 [Enterococcus gilvus]
MPSGILLLFYDDGRERNMNPFEEKIRQLRAGEIERFEVSREDFFLFREVWLKQEDKKFFRGIAGLKGMIIYVYDTTIV